MELVRYSQVRLLKAAFKSGIVALAVTLFFLNRGIVAWIPGWVRLFATDFGHFVLAPVLIVGCGTYFWRTSLRLSGQLAAVDAGADEVAVTTLWDRVRIPWTRLDEVRVQRLGIGFGVHGSLIFVTGEKRYRVLLRLSDLDGSRAGEMAARIEGLREAALGAAAAGSSDDPIERYLARKAAARGESAKQRPAEAGAAVMPVRPAFGRKAVPS